MKLNTRANDWSTVSPEVRAFTHQHFVDMYLASNKRSQVGLLLSAALVAVLWATSGNVVPALTWWIPFAVYEAWRILRTDQLIKGISEQKSTRRILLFLVIAGMTQAVPLLWFDEFSEVQRAAITIIMCSTAAASVSTTVGYRLYFLAYALPMLVPLQVAWVAVHWRSGVLSSGLALAGLILVYVAVLVSVARQSFATFAESCRIRFGERELNQQLSAALERESEANRAKTQFLAAASHDLRQPIHSLNVLVAALAQRPLDERSREIVKLLQTVNESLSSELDGLLEISKLDAGAVKPMLAPVSLSDLLLCHAATLTPLATERGIRIDVRVADGIWAHTDGVLLQRVFSNLTSNALKFTPPGGEIRLAVSTDSEHATLSVKDTGIGISPEYHERVFREFFQISNTERDRSRGLGLGLSIVRRYSDLLGIRVGLASRLSEGTAVTLQLPVLTAAQTPAVRSEQVTGAEFPADFTVLLLDDEAQIRESMRLIFEEWGIRLLAVESIESAEKVLRTQRLDFVLSDLRLRDGDSGLQVLTLLRALELSVPMALITGDTAPERIALAQQAGVPLFHKPVPATQLLALLRTAVH